MNDHPVYAPKVAAAEVEKLKGTPSDYPIHDAFSCAEIFSLWLHLSLLCGNIWWVGGEIEWLDGSDFP